MHTTSRSRPSIVLTTLNARYIHASLGLRYLLANMGELRAATVLKEFTISRAPAEIAESLLAAFGPEPPVIRILGLGVYIWNVEPTTALIRLLKASDPGLKIVLGGPEVSHETAGQEIVGLADHVITGWGDISFPRLCHALLKGPRPIERIIAGIQPPLDQIALPYAEYTADDLANRQIYVEASRGCPFKCEFCLSALDKTAWAFDQARFLDALMLLFQRGARNFKFVDRTFNLKVDASIRILQFFLDRLAESTDKLFVHFELVPDHLPERLKAMIARFPPGVLQFEIGVQSFNSEVQQRISRHQDNHQTEANLRWLAAESHAHLHADLIFGLPGESLESFAAGFDRLFALGPHEIQLGILKRLRGTPIVRHAGEFALVFDERPPYAIRETADLDVETVRRFERFARYWDLIANTGRFRLTLDLLLRPDRCPGGSPFQAFMTFSDWLWQRDGKTHGITPEDLVNAFAEYLSGRLSLSPETAKAALLADYLASGARSNPAALSDALPKRVPPGRLAKSLSSRQQRHRAAD